MRPDVSDYHMARVSEILTSSSFQFNNLGGEEKSVAEFCKKRSDVLRGGK